MDNKLMYLRHFDHRGQLVHPDAEPNEAWIREIEDTERFFKEAEEAEHKVENVPRLYPYLEKLLFEKNFVATETDYDNLDRVGGNLPEYFTPIQRDIENYDDTNDRWNSDFAWDIDFQRILKEEWPGLFYAVDAAIASFLFFIQRFESII